MSLRTSLVLLLLLVMVAGYLVFSQFRPPPSQDEPPPPWFYAVTSEDILKVTISYQGQEQAFLQGGEGWYFDDAYQTPVDMDRWGGVLSLLGGPQSRRLLVQEAEDLSTYGLDPPQGRLEVQLTGERELRILLGSKTEDGSSHYAQLEGSPQVYLVDASWGDVLTGLATDLPYPKWYYRSPAKRASELKVTYQGSEVSFVKDSKRGWQFDTSNRADERPPVDPKRWETEVMPLLNGPSVQYQVVPELKDPAKYGLEEPFAIIQIEYGTIEKTATGDLEVFHNREWDLGTKTEDGKSYYTKLFGFPPVVAVDAQWVEGLLAIAQDPPHAEGMSEASS